MVPGPQTHKSHGPFRLAMPRFPGPGLVNTRAMYARALDGGYAVPGYNFNTLEQVHAMVVACARTASPLVMQYYTIPREQFPPVVVTGLASIAVDLIAALHDELGTPLVPVALHLDHGASVEQCKACIEAGFSSVMIDGSTLPFEQNVAVTRQVVDLAREHDVSVEGELGAIGGAAETHGHVEPAFTDPGDVVRFVDETGVDSLAVSVGTSHGAYKLPAANGQAPALRFDLLEAIGKAAPRLPLVLHGASSVPAGDVAVVNAHGGVLRGAAGIPEEQVRAACATTVCKVNIHSDTQVAFTGAVRKHLATRPVDVDPRTYLHAASEVLVALYVHKNEHVLGAAGRAVW